MIYDVICRTSPSKSTGKSVAVLVESRRYERLRELDDAAMRLELRAALRGRKYGLEDVLNALSAR